MATIKHTLTGAAAAAALGAGLIVPAAPALADTNHPNNITRASLLTGTDYLRSGFGKADVYNGFEGDGGLSFGECSSRLDATAQPGYRDLEARLVVGLQTDAFNEAVDFSSPARARAYAALLAERLGSCEQRNASWDIRAAHRPRLSGADDSRWWLVRNRDSGARIVVGYTRVDDRIALIRLTSMTSSPAQTTDIDALLTRAVRRLPG